MYSGTTFRTKSGRMMGVHQKIDRVAYRHLAKHIPNGVTFPKVQQILHFEGLNGPDGVKRKSPGRDEPWHFIDPDDPNDRQIITMITDHIYNMSRALQSDNIERVAFEAAWMAHAIVDGLTPAHHYPLEEKLEELRGGEGLETRTTAKTKLLLPGETRRHQLRNNWEFWGAKGVMTTHLAFELGIATTIAPGRFADPEITDNDITLLNEGKFEQLFMRSLHTVAEMKMYEEFTKNGWTRHLANETKSVLVPEIVRAVMLGWYQAIIMAEKSRAR